MWLRGLLALAVIGNLCTPAHGTERLGIVLIHGKNGLPGQFEVMAAALSAEAYLTEQPEMCWSRNRIYDRLYLDCLSDIDAAIQRLKARGATSVVLVGMSLGGNAALGYGARRSGLRGIIGLVPAHAPEFISRRPEIASELARARLLIAQGRGDTPVTFTDVNTRTTVFNFTVSTTPKIYLSFFAPDSAAVMPNNAVRLSAPLLYVSATHDPTQRGRDYVFARAPAHPLNRYVTLNSDHIGVPAASQGAVMNWLKDLLAP